MLVTGESGTGKEVVARFLHRGSRRAKGPFVALNCAALPEQLLESELFGHERGAFREDLYYRLGVFEIRLPPLRERPDDILVLAEAFLEEVGRTIGRPAAGISEDAREQLLAHAWPGNVRELRNAIERAVIFCRGGLLAREHLPLSVARPEAERVAVAMSKEAEFPVEGVALETVERELLEKALARAGQNKSKAAKLLGISRGQLYSLLRRHGLTDARR